MLLETLKRLGYTTAEFLLTPLQFGIPNSRLRYYLLAKSITSGSFVLPEEPQDGIWRYIPGQPGDSWVDPRLKSGASGETIEEIRVFLDIDQDEHEIPPHAVPDKILSKWGRLFDIVVPSSRRSCCFTRGTTCFPVPHTLSYRL